MILHRPEVIRQYHDDNQWGTRTLDDLFQENVHRHPERLAVAEAPNRTALTPGEPRRLTYAELSGEVERTAAGLLANGVGKDSVVVVQLPNIVELLLLYLACARIGAVISPMPMQYREHEIGQLLDALGPVGAIVTVAWFKREQRADAWEILLRERGNRTPLMAYGDDSGRHAPPCSASMDTPRAREAVARYRAGIDISADDIYTICWTSGTTSTPKGVPRSHNNWLLYARIVSEVCDVRDGERMLNPFSFVNLSGIGISLVIWLFKAGTVHLHHPFDREVFLRQVADEHISLAVAAPAMLSAILGDPTLTERHDLRSLRCVMSGSTGLSGTMIAEYERRFGIAIVNGFGSNEGITLTSSAREIPNPLRRAEYFPRIGAPDVAPTMRYHRWIHSKLVDPESGQEIVMPGISGELLMKSGAVFPGYYRRPELTAEVFDPDGYFRTGDLFQIALGDEGQPTLYRFVGRLRSVINRGGMKISPEELGGLMEQHPSIAEADAIGYPDAVLGERVCACVALRPNTALALADLVAFLADQGIAKYKLPERLVILDQLPRNPIGKVQREPLRLAVLGVPQDASVAP